MGGLEGRKGEGENYTDIISEIKNNLKTFKFIEQDTFLLSFLNLCLSEVLHFSFIIFYIGIEINIIIILSYILVEHVT